MSSSKDIDQLESLWIINSKGLCLLQQAFTDKREFINKSIFSSFVSALLNFSDSVFDDQIDKISMGKIDVFCMPFEKGRFFVTIAARRGASEKYIQKKIKEIGDAFGTEYSENIDCDIYCEDDFTPFIHTVDKIFGIETIRVIPEHYEFLDLLKMAEINNFTEEQTVETILDFFEQLTNSKREFLLQTTLPIVSIFTDSTNLTYEQMKRFQDILSLDL